MLTLHAGARSASWQQASTQLREQAHTKARARTCTHARTRARACAHAHVCFLVKWFESKLKERPQGHTDQEEEFHELLYKSLSPKM